MKKIFIVKKAIVAVLILAICFTLCACGASKKTAITKSEFISKAEDSGLYTQDVTSQFTNAPELVSATVAGKAEGSSLLWQVEFYEIDSVEFAKADYNQNKESLDSGSGVSTSVTKGNYSTFSKTGDGLYKYLCRVDSTFIYASVKEQYMDEVKAFIEKLGY